MLVLVVSLSTRESVTPGEEPVKMKFGLSTLSEAGNTHVLVSGALELTSGDLSIINVFLFLH